jgi:hypothetical protein
MNVSKRIAPGAYQALRDALAVVFWRKRPFENFLRAALRDDPELLAGHAPRTREGESQAETEETDGDRPCNLRKATRGPGECEKGAGGKARGGAGVRLTPRGERRYSPVAPCRETDTRCRFRPCPTLRRG